MRFRRIHRDSGRFREIQGDSRRFRRIHGYSRRFWRIQGDSRRFREARRFFGISGYNPGYSRIVRWIPGYLSRFGELKEILRDAKRFLWNSGEYTGSQEILEGIKVFEGLTGVLGDSGFRKIYKINRDLKRMLRDSRGISEGYRDFKRDYLKI